jgi:hypothetical protein
MDGIGEVESPFHLVHLGLVGQGREERGHLPQKTRMSLGVVVVVALPN